jgi:hypothetical protein
MVKNINTRRNPPGLPGEASAGNLRLFPAGQSVPTISTVSYGAGQTRASNAVLPLSASGELAVFVSQPTGTTAHVIIDVSGYFE